MRNNVQKSTDFASNISVTLGLCHDMNIICFIWFENNMEKNNKNDE